MKKIFIILFLSGICFSLFYLTLELKKVQFEREISKPEFTCGSVDEMPKSISMSDKEIEKKIGFHDKKECLFHDKDLAVRPILQIGPGEYLANICSYVYSGIPCSHMPIYHIKLHFMLEQFTMHQYNFLADDICISSKMSKPYIFPNRYGVMKAVPSYNFIVFQDISKVERQKIVNRKRNEILEEMQEKWRQEVRKYRKCSDEYLKVLEIWEKSYSVSSFCDKLSKIKFHNDKVNEYIKFSCNVK